ncbi:unnamed protein product [Dibothriocephalus latus]|uniref:Choline/carnitine acyltransferase domain-containing protein n=1 Tax=Dibothriocephalus latus TaxID=60516 RepID=A0A3P7N9K4_DIBLA|nr:unnamed protein product [Dibothriocephalus latus]
MFFFSTCNILIPNSMIAGHILLEILPHPPLTNQIRPFLFQILSEPWRLSTSQTPIRQCSSCFYPSDYLGITATPGGGFGPVTADGYGVSYIFAGEDHIFLHISSYRTSKETVGSSSWKNVVYSFPRPLFLKVMNE